MKAEVEGFKESLRGYERENKDLEAKNAALQLELEEQIRIHKELGIKTEGVKHRKTKGRE